MRERVAAARARQLARQGVCNAGLTVADLQRHGVPDGQARALATRAMSRFGLSARAYHRILKVARTIADLAGADAVGPAHVAESIALRRVHAAGASPHETAAPGRQGTAA